MKCDKAIDLLSEYIDEELDAKQREEVETHVAECEKCRGELDSLKATVSLVGSLSAVKAPEQLAAGVSQALEEEERGKIIWPSARMIGSLLAAAAVLLVVSVTFVMQNQRPMESMAPAEKSPAIDKVASKELAKTEELEKEKPAEAPALDAVARKEARPMLKADKAAADREEDKFGYEKKVEFHRRRAKLGRAQDAKEVPADKSAAIARAEPETIAVPAKEKAEAVPGPAPALPVVAPAKPESVRVIAKAIPEKKVGRKLAEGDGVESRRAEEATRQIADQLAVAPRDEAKKVAAPGVQMEVAGRRVARTKAKAGEELARDDDRAPAPARAVAKTKPGEGFQDDAMKRSRAPAAPRPEPTVAKAKQREFGAQSKAVAGKASAAPAEPTRSGVVSKRTKGAAKDAQLNMARTPVAQAEMRTIIIRSRNLQADMATVRSLLADRYAPRVEGQQKAERLDAPVQQRLAGNRIETTIPANQINVLLGDLKRLNLAAVPKWDERGQAAGLKKQQEFAQTLEQEAAAPGKIHVTIIFEQAR